MIANLSRKGKHGEFIVKALDFIMQPKYIARVKRWTWAFVRSIFILGFCFVILYPVLIMISKAFMSKADIYDNTVLLVPKHFTLQNIKLAAVLIKYWASLKNTLILSVGVTVLQTVVCMTVGYGFARYNFKFKGILFGLVIFTIIVPPQLILVSLYLHFRFFDLFGIIKALTGIRGINLMESFVPFFLLAGTGMGIKNGLFIYIFRQFFRAIPKETEEAALVDGAGPIRTYIQIMIPGAITAMVTVALFSFVWQYNDTVYAGLFLKNTKVLSITYDALATFTPEAALTGVTQSDLSNPIYLTMVKSTGVFIMLIPVVIFFLFLQRFFIQSIERSGLVG